MAQRTYSVYLVQRHGQQGGQREVTSPVQGSELNFYDSGVWLERDRGRNFFPYEQIRTIREHPEGEQPGDAGRDADGEPDQSLSVEGGDDRRDAGADDDSVEGESGATEDLVEE